MTPRPPLLDARGRSRAVASLVALSASVIAGGWFVERGTRSDKPSAYESARLFDEVRAHVVRDYVDSMPNAQLYRKAVDGLLYELDDPYSTFLSVARLQQLAETTSGNYAGVGVQVDVSEDGLIVMGSLPGSPADSAGLQPGDRLIEIEGRSTDGWTLEEAGRALRGTPGTRVRVRVDRVGSPAPFALALRRARIHVSSVTHAEMLTTDVGYIELRVFSDSSALEVGRAVDALRARGMRSLVLDLRANPGGLLDEGVRVSDLFLDTGATILKTRSRTTAESRDYTDRTTQRWPSLPLTVLVDGRSASAAEIVAGALQDHDRAALVGTPTYGKGSAQTIFPLGEGGLKLTTTRWYTPVGRSIARRVDRASEFDFPGEERQRPKVRTVGGRLVEGGGGIVPDLMAGDTVPDVKEAALSAAIAEQGATFRKVLSAFALEIKKKGLAKRPDFGVSPAMLDTLYVRFQARKLELPRGVYSDAAPVISQLLSYEIARYVFGPAVEFRRRANDDVALRAALRVASGARTAKDPLRRVAGVPRAGAVGKKPG